MMQNRDVSFHRRLGALVAVVTKAAVLLPLGSVCIWWAYSMNRVVGGGEYTPRQAFLLTVAMSGLTTTLAAVVWIVSPFLHKRQTWLGLAFKTAIETGAILCLYTAVVFARRQSWTPAKGLTEEAAFMPVLGHLNAAFFSDFLWLEYLMAVVPFVSILSGVLTSMVDALQSQRQLKPVANVDI
jgi:hypothetical protein